jgi:hypothetical protein
VLNSCGRWLNKATLHPSRKLHDNKGFEHYDQHDREDTVGAEVAAELQQQTADSGRDHEQFGGDHAGQGPRQTNAKTCNDARHTATHQYLAPDLTLRGTERLSHFDKSRVDGTYASSGIERDEYPGEEDQDDNPRRETGSDRHQNSGNSGNSGTMGTPSRMAAYGFMNWPRKDQLVHTSGTAGVC